MLRAIVLQRKHVVQPDRQRAQVDLDIAQRFACGQLGKGHGEELIQTRELLDFVVAPVRRNTTPKRGEWQMGHDLCKHEHALMHGSLWRIAAKDSNSARQRSNRDQTKSPVSITDSLTYNRLS